MSCLEKAKQLQSMIAQGQVNEALNELYAEDCTIVEGNGQVRSGRSAQLEAVKEWQNSISEMHGAGVGCITSDEENGVTCVESWMDVTYQGGHRAKLEEVAVQKWKDGRIVHERFYFDVPPGMEAE